MQISHNVISQDDPHIKYFDGTYDPVLHLSYNSKMKETFSKFPLALSYRLKIRILARNHGIQVLNDF